MNYAEICIIKRDGKREDFSISKIKNAIGKAFHASGIDNEDKLIAEITMRVISNFVSPTISVEEIQDLVEKELMKVRPEVAKKYIIYREWRNTERDRKTQMKHIMDGIVAIDKNDVNLSNANMSSHTPAGQMMTFASEVTKDYTYKYLLPKKYAEAHQLGDIHIHDLDYYPTKTTTCIQYDLDDLFERGFRTKNGSIRTPQSIQSYATLATIIFQTNQNEQHGGQAIPAFDFFMAEGVRKTFRKHLKTLTEFYIEVEGKEPGTEALKKIEEKAYAMTRKDTHQAMEGFIHNLNTMHSRGGNQVVFSSINYGTDTSPEGRMVKEELLKACQYAYDLSVGKHVIIEKYISDTDADKVDFYYLAEAGKLTLLSSCDTINAKNNGMSKVVQSAWLYPERHIEAYNRKVRSRIEAMIQGMGIQYGCIFFSGFIDKNQEFVFFECGFRLEGAHQAYYVQKKGPVNFLDTFIQHALYGSTDGVERTPVNEKMKCVTVNVFAKTGTIAEIEGPSEIAQMQDCTLSLLHGRIGQKCTDDSAILSKIYVFAFSSESVEELKLDVEKAYAKLKITDEHGKDMIYDRMNPEEILTWWNA